MSSVFLQKLWLPPERPSDSIMKASQKKYPISRYPESIFIVDYPLTEFLTWPKSYSASFCSCISFLFMFTEIAKGKVQVVIAFGTLENGLLSVLVIFSKAVFCWVFINCASRCRSTHLEPLCLLHPFLILGNLKLTEVA